MLAFHRLLLGPNLLAEDDNRVLSALGLHHCLADGFEREIGCAALRVPRETNCYSKIGVIERVITIKAPSYYL